MRTCTDPVSTDSLPTRTVGASTTLPNFSIKPGKLFINGEWRDSASSKTFDVIDPPQRQLLPKLQKALKKTQNQRSQLPILRLKTVLGEK